MSKRSYESACTFIAPFMKMHRAKPAPEMERSGIEGGMAEELGLVLRKNDR
jgi:hypothetical protein